MSGHVHIVTRETKDGDNRYLVRYRRGGRGFPIQHAGSFRTLKEARERLQFVAGELAAGRSPREALEALQRPQTPATRRLRDLVDGYIASRLDLEPTTERITRSHVRRILPAFGNRDPASITVADVQAWAAEQANGTDDEKPLKPSSLKRYIATLRLLLDYADVVPNPARDPKVKLPRIVEEEPSPPTAQDLLTMLVAMPARYRLAVVTLEQTGMRVGELVALTWADVDERGLRLRLPRRSTKTRSARWAQVPGWLMERISATCPREDRVEGRRVFQGLDEQAIKRAMRSACSTAGIAHYHPHDLRHRRLTIWHHEGVPLKVMAERAGHSRATITLETYSHAMPVDEAEIDALEALLVMPR